MKTKKITTTKYIEETEGLEFQFNPVEDSITLEKDGEGATAGYKLKYLVQDEDPQSPNDDGDSSLFLVHYHQDFWIERKDVLSKDDLAAIYQHGTDLEKEPENPEEYDDLSTARDLWRDYWVFPVSALIHSGVWLSLGRNFSCDPGGWDTSHVGAIFASKKEFTEREAAAKAAEGLIEMWNQYLSGDVYGCIVEKLDKDKKNVDTNSCWGFYGHKYALEALKNEF